MTDPEKVVQFTPRVVQKGPKLPSQQQWAPVPDTEKNRNRQNQGPAIGKVCWFCPCGSAAFYVTPAAIRCYICHEEPVWR